MRRTFAVQRSCALEQLATTLHPSAVCFFLANVQNVSPAHAPSPSITAGKRPFRLSRGEQALASTPQIPTKGSAGSTLKRLRSVAWSQFSLAARSWSDLKSRSAFRDCGPHTPVADTDKYPSWTS